MAAALRSGQIAMGPQVAKFERAFAAKFAFRDAAAVASGTAALHLSLLALGVKRGDEVIVPTHVCTALLHAVNHAQATPVLADVNEADANISAQDVKRKISRRTKAIIVPHMFGSPADLLPLLKLGVPVIEDCAQAVGARYADKPVGSWGAMGAFSFYATKMMATGEGGMVVARERRMIAEVRDLLSYDNRPDYKVRFNYKMTDVEAVLGLAQLKQLPAFIARRKALAAMYDKALEGLSCVLPLQMAKAEHVYYRYVIRVRVPAEKFIAAMKRQGISCERPLYKPLHRYLGLKGFSVSETWMKNSVSLPLYPAMTDAEARRIAAAARSIILSKGGGV